MYQAGLSGRFRIWSRNLPSGDQTVWNSGYFGMYLISSNGKSSKKYHSSDADCVSRSKKLRGYDFRPNPDMDCASKHKKNDPYHLRVEFTGKWCMLCIHYMHSMEECKLLSGFGEKLSTQWTCKGNKTNRTKYFNTIVKKEVNFIPKEINNKKLSFKIKINNKG